MIKIKIKIKFSRSVAKTLLSGSGQNLQDEREDVKWGPLQSLSLLSFVKCGPKSKGWLFSWTEKNWNVLCFNLNPKTAVLFLF